MKEKNILYLHSASDLYGASRVALESIKAFQNAGHKVTFALSYRGPICLELEKLGVHLEVIPLATIRRKYFTPRGLLNRVFSWLKSWKELNRIHAERDIDLVISNTTSLLIGAYFSKRNDLKHIWHVHEIQMGPIWLQSFYSKIMVRKADLVLVVSDAVKKHWLSLNPQIRISRVYNGFDFKAFEQVESELREELELSQNTLIVGMIARVHFWKGQEYFLDIAKELSGIFNDIKFIMVGDAYKGYEYLYDKIDLRIKRHGLENHVINLGFREDVSNILKAFDLFILPSILPDPLPTTVLEAMACGTPVAATAHGGACEMVLENETGVLIPWDDAQKSAVKIAKILENPQKRMGMSRNSIRRVESHFSKTSFEANITEAISRL